jgi:hypothetical protein
VNSREVTGRASVTFALGNSSDAASRSHAAASSDAFCAWSDAAQASAQPRDISSLITFSDG